MSDLERIGDGLEGVLRRLGLPSPDALDRLVNDWPALAGEPWASRAVPVGLRDGELLLEVADGATASLLKYQSGALAEHLERALGARFVDAVRIRVGRPKKTF